MRELAIIFVMLSHLNTWTSLGPLGKYLHFLFVDATSWFVFLSGYLFVRIEGTRFSYPAYMAKKAKFVILPYLILSTPVMLLGLYLGQNKLIGISAGAFAAWSLLVGGYVVAPMWFIPMIAIFFLLSPVFLRIARSPLYSLWALSVSYSRCSRRARAHSIRSFHSCILPGFILWEWHLQSAPRTRKKSPDRQCSGHA